MACSHRNEGRGLPWVDRFELIDIADWEALKKIAEEEGVQLVYSVGSDLALPSVAKIAKNVGLPSFFDSETLEALQNKVRLREMLAKHRLGEIQYRVVRRPSDMEG